MKTNSDGKMYADLETFEKSENFKSFVVFLNNFPYYLESNIKHYMIFSLKALDNPTIEKIIQQQIKPQESCYVDSRYWQNPQNLKSIPDFWHAHVLVKINNAKL